MFCLSKSLIFLAEKDDGRKVARMTGLTLFACDFGRGEAPLKLRLHVDFGKSSWIQVYVGMDNSSGILKKQSQLKWFCSVVSSVKFCTCMLKNVRMEPIQILSRKGKVGDMHKCGKCRDRMQVCSLCSPSPSDITRVCVAQCRRPVFHFHPMMDHIPSWQCAVWQCAVCGSVPWVMDMVKYCHPTPVEFLISNIWQSRDISTWFISMCSAWI